MTFDHLNDGLKQDQEPTLMTLITFVSWTACLVVEIVGMARPHRLPSPPRPEPSPVVATMLNVSISDSPAVPNEVEQLSKSASDEQDPAPVPAVTAPDTAPPVQSVADPSPRIAFAIPTKASANSVPGNEHPTLASNNSTSPVVHHLVYGQGEGQQPAPEYPREAAIAGEQGTVVVRFTVGEDGRVQSAAASSPCQSPILNSAAVRAVKDSWLFKTGPVRIYEVSIVYQLN